MQSILHSLLPKNVLNHSTPRPVHSALLADMSSTAALARAFAVELAMSMTVALNSVALLSEVLGLGRNQLLRKSKKHRSDQLHEVKKRTRRRIEQ